MPSTSTTSRSLSYCLLHRICAGGEPDAQTAIARSNLSRLRDSIASYAAKESGKRAPKIAFISDDAEQQRIVYEPNPCATLQFSACRL